jgi:hypothetical protein
VKTNHRFALPSVVFIFFIELINVFIDKRLKLGIAGVSDGNIDKKLRMV